MEATFRMEQFRRPAPTYGIHPFWFWNGAMEDGEIVRQIEEMADKDVGGFFICPRQGLQVPYLSDAWFAKVRLAVETAKGVGMEVWLYDEYPYPSGMAGGEVTLAHPEAKHCTLEHRAAALSGGETCSLNLPWGKVLYAKAVPIGPEGAGPQWDAAIDIQDNVGNHQAEPIFQKAGLTAYNRKRFFTYKTIKKLQWTAPSSPAGTWEVHVFLEVEIEDFKYYGTYVDPCNEEAMRTFLAVTHDRYAREIGEYFGGTVKGMFTDEIGLLGKRPWSRQLPAAFRERNGYDLRERLHDLLHRDGERSAKVRYDYYQTIHELLRSSYHKQVHDWCERHGLQYAAEVPSVRMTTQLYSHVPSGDSGHEKLGRTLEWILDRYASSLRYNPKMISSIANQLARDRALIECFHSVGWSMTLQDAKWMIDRLAAMGVNFFNFHAFFYTLDGITKHDAPPSQFLQNPYWSRFGALGGYVRRISYIMSCGAPERSIAVLDPTTTFWTHMGNPFHDFQYGGRDEQEEAELDRLKRQWFDLCKALALHQRDFDHLDPELLAEAAVEDGVIRIGRAAYTALVLPPMTNLESKAWRKAKAFLDGGGVVIAVGELPFETIEADAAGASVAREMREALEPVAPDRLLPLLEERLPERFRLRTEAKRPFLMHRRRLDDGSMLVFVSNQEGGTHEALLELDDEGGFFEQAVRLDLEKGTAVPIGMHREASADASTAVRAISLRFAPYESVLLHLRESPAHADGEGSVSAPWVWEVDATGNWDIRAESDNALRFDTFELRLAAPGEEASFAEGAVVEAKTFIDQCEDAAGSQRLPLRFSQLFGTPMKIGAAYPILCRYSASFEADRLPDICYVLMDRGAISGDFVLRINDMAYTREQFEHKFVYDHLNQVCDVRDALKPGTNTLTVDVTVEQDWDGVVDALYVLGDFAVQFGDTGGPALCERPPQAPLFPSRSAPAEGFPYYAGTMSYRRTVELQNVPHADGPDAGFTLRFRGWDPHFHDCAEVVVNGRSLGVRPWTPYEWSGPASLLQEGANEVEIRMTGTLIGLLEGKSFDYASHTLKDVKKLAAHDAGPCVNH